MLHPVWTYLKNSNAVEKLILLSLVVFVLGLFVPQYVTLYGALSGDYTYVLQKPWSALTYAFVHLRFVHLLANLIILFYIGTIFLDFFSEKQVYYFFIWGSVFGAVFFLVYNSWLTQQPYANLVGASAGIAALASGVVVKVPHYSLHIRFIGTVKLWVLIVIGLSLSVLELFTLQTGAAVAHLAGFYAGAVLTYYHEKSTFKNKKTKSPFKRVFLNPKAPKVKKSYRTKLTLQQEIDDILDKISRKGYDALTDDEKEFLKQQRD